MVGRLGKALYKSKSIYHDDDDDCNGGDQIWRCVACDDSDDVSVMTSVGQ